MRIKTIKLVSDQQGLDCLEKEWDVLLNLSRNRSVFLTWEWVRTWWEVFKEGKELFIIVFRDENETLCGMAPFYRMEKLRRPFRVRELRFLGFGEEVKPDYLGVISAPEMEKEVTAALCGYLQEVSSEWDTLYLTDIPEELPYLEEIARFYKEKRYLIHQKPSADCTYIPLDISYDRFIGTLGKNLQYNIGRRTKTLFKNFKTEFFLWEDPFTVREGIEHLGFLHRRRWVAKESNHSFSSDRYLVFHQQIAERFLRKGWLRLYGLKVDGAIVALLYCYRYLGKIYYYQSGFDPDWYKYSVGLVLRASALRHAIEEGASEFDFLRGDHGYKQEWSQKTRTTRALYLAKPALSSRLDFAVQVGLPLIKSRLRKAWTSVAL